MPTYHPAETLLIEGPDATTFAHAQFSSAVSSLATGQWQFSAWLDPQGRVRALFHLARLADDRHDSWLRLVRLVEEAIRGLVQLEATERDLTVLPLSAAAVMADALRRFVFRSKVSVTALPPRTLATGPTLPLHTIMDDGLTVLLGCDAHSLRITTAGNGDDAWRLPQLRAGWPWLPTQLLNELLPSALSLQRLHAVAIDKGCYPGQEIVARLHFRGGHKRHLHRVTLSHAARAGDTLRHDGRDIGCVLDVITTGEGTEALVVLSDDIATRASDAHAHPLDDNLVMKRITSWPA